MRLGFAPLVCAWHCVAARWLVGPVRAATRHLLPLLNPKPLLRARHQTAFVIRPRQVLLLE